MQVLGTSILITRLKARSFNKYTLNKIYKKYIVGKVYHGTCNCNGFIKYGPVKLKTPNRVTIALRDVSRADAPSKLIKKNNSKKCSFNSV